MLKAKKFRTIVAIVLSLTITAPIMQPVVSSDAAVECCAKKKKKTKKTYVYYVPGSSYAYHCTKKCRTLARSKYIAKATLKKAKAMNLRACKVCYR